MGHCLFLCCSSHATHSMVPSRDGLETGIIIFAIAFTIFAVMGVANFTSGAHFGLPSPTTQFINRYTPLCYRMSTTVYGKRHVRFACYHPWILDTNCLYGGLYRSYLWPLPNDVPVYLVVINGTVLGRKAVVCELFVLVETVSLN